MRLRLRPVMVAAPLAVLALALGLAQLGPVNGRPLYGYLSSFAIVIGAGLLVPAIMYGLARAGLEVLRRRLGVERLLAHANLTAAIPRLSISVAALSVSLSMMVAIAIMIGSFRDTVVYWVGQTLQADFIGPGIRPTMGRTDVVAGGDRRAAHPDVPPSTASGNSTSFTTALSPRRGTSMVLIPARCCSRARPAREAAAGH
jgi:putative ABC transport system permease protein